MTEPRPTRMTDDMALEAAKIIASDLSRAGHLHDMSFDCAASDIAAVARRHMDGYELAKELDQWKGWHITTEIVETLDGYSSAAGSIVLKAQREWVERNNIQPPHEIGTRVRITWLRETVEGVIHDVYDHGAAQYLITPEGWQEGQGRPIVYFESVEVIE